jgi:hypothetical protein
MNKSLSILFCLLMTSQAFASLTSQADGYVALANSAYNNAVWHATTASSDFDEGEDMTKSLEGLWQGPPVDSCYQPYAESARAKITSAENAKNAAATAVNSAGTALANAIACRNQVEYYEGLGNDVAAADMLQWVIYYAGVAENMEDTAHYYKEIVLDLVGDIAVLQEQADGNC